MARLYLSLMLAMLIASVEVQADEAPQQRSHEFSARMITLPTGDGGAVSALGCSACKALALIATAATVYQIGEERVTLAAMRQAFAERPDAIVTVLATTDLKSVEQIVMVAATQP